MAIANVKRVSIGGGISLITGSYTHTVGAADETYTIDGDVIGINIQSFSDDGPFDLLGTGACQVSTSGYVTTITFRGVAGITSGRFMVWVNAG